MDSREHTLPRAPRLQRSRGEEAPESLYLFAYPGFGLPLEGPFCRHLADGIEIWADAVVNA